VFSVIDSKIRSIIKSYVNFVGLRLVEAFETWLDTNRGKIDPQLYDRLKREIHNANVSTVQGIVDTVRWMQCALYEMSCYILIGLDEYWVVQCDGYDMRATTRLAYMMYYAFGLQRIPQELRD
jgi:hypothetical protein